MRKIFFSAVLFFLAACTGSKPVLYDCVQKNWHYVSARDEHGNDFKKVSATDILSLTGDKGKNNFKYDIALENIHASGMWELRDSTLVFTYNPKPTDTDSTRRTVRYFKITECSGTVWYSPKKESHLLFQVKMKIKTCFDNVFPAFATL